MTCCFFDDICVTGENNVEHLRNLEMVLARLKDHGIRLRKEKCAFMKESVEYLGFRISREGLSPLTSKVRAIVEAPPPTDIQQLRSYLGMLHYYDRFIPDLSTVLHPMNALLQSSSRWSWTKECAEAFASSKQLFAGFHGAYALRYFFTSHSGM